MNAQEAQEICLEEAELSRSDGLLVAAKKLEDVALFILTGKEVIRALTAENARLKKNFQKK